MPVAVAFCPCPPLLVPALSTGAAGEAVQLRTACAAAVAELVAAAPARIRVLAATDEPGEWDAGTGGTLRGHGVDVRAGGDDLRLPAALTIGAWLLDRAGWSGDRCYTGVRDGIEVSDVREAWLVLGDGTARRTEKAPGFVDERATRFDDAVARALATGDVTALGDLDLALAAELWCSGARVWRAVARALPAGVASARLLAEEAPYGVDYLVATWTPAR